jgi:hypothetical protein
MMQSTTKYAKQTSLPLLILIALLHKKPQKTKQIQAKRISFYSSRVTISQNYRPFYNVIQLFLLTLHRFFGQHSKAARLRVMAN